MRQLHKSTYGDLEIELSTAIPQIAFETDLCRIVIIVII